MNGNEVKEVEKICEIARRLSMTTTDVLSKEDLDSSGWDAVAEAYGPPCNLILIGRICAIVSSQLCKKPEFRLLKASWDRLGVECGNQVCMLSFARFFGEQQGALGFQNVFRLLDPRFGDTDDYFEFARREDFLVKEKRPETKSEATSENGGQGAPLQMKDNGDLPSAAKQLPSAVVILDRVEVTDSDDPRSEFAKYAFDDFELKTLGDVDLQQIQRILDDEFPWFRKVTHHIIQQLVFRAHGDGIFGFRPLLLLGSPGVGKTRYTRRLSDISRVPWRLIGLAGRADNKDITGTARGWNSACPGIPLRTIAQEKVANPIILLDEIDKAGGSDHNGRVHDALIPLLERSSASTHQDEFLQVRTDLSHISWIATANSVAMLPGPLLSRFQTIMVEGPKHPEDYRKIIQITAQEFAARHGIRSEFLPRLGPEEMLALRPFMKNPRRLAKATERLLSVLLSKPADGRIH